MTTRRTVRVLGVSEKAFQAQVVHLARLYGWRVCATWLSWHSPAGEPDLRLLRPPRYIVAELKSETGKVSAPQAEYLALAALCPGIESFVWRPSDMEEIVTILR